MIFRGRQSQRGRNKAGVEGEKSVSLILRQLSPEYIIFNDVMLRTRKGSSQIDHIVVSPYGIFVIETKNYSGVIRGTDAMKYWEKYYSNKPMQYFYSPVLQNSGHIKALSMALGIPPEYMQGIVVFTGNSVDMNGVCSSTAIYINYLLSSICRFNKRIISYECVWNIAECIKSLNINSPYMRRKHKAYVSRVMRSQDRWG